MQGLMMDFPLTVRHILTRATTLFAQKEIVTRTEDGYLRHTYRDMGTRVARLANVLHDMGVGPGDRVATFAWNTHRHLELYFAAPCMGAVLHTLNLRLFAEQLAFIVNDAADTVLFVDADLVPLVEKFASQIPTVKRFVVMGTLAHPPSFGPVEDYETLLADAPETYGWPTLDENAAAAMCYTSGTTGNPKGVVYSHRSTFLHSTSACMVDTLATSERDVILPVVPMFHANAWGLPYAAAMVGATQVLPGRFITPPLLVQMMREENVTVAAGVPSIWVGVASYLEAQPQPVTFPHMRALVCGGSAASATLIAQLDRFGLPLLHAWGMTETSPLGSVCRVKSTLENGSEAEKIQVRAKQGIVSPGVEMRIMDIATGREAPWDGHTYGELQVRGPWIARAYYHDDSTDKFVDGWLRTGDVATVDADGYIQIVDRTKDLVKSGGEWISSIELENLIVSHPLVQEAAVIGVPHPVMQERPVAYVVPKPGAAEQLTPAAVLDFLRPHVAKWWLPDEVILTESIPKTGVGKFNKRELREMHASHTDDHPTA